MERPTSSVVHPAGYVPRQQSNATSRSSITFNSCKKYIYIHEWLQSQENAAFFHLHSFIPTSIQDGVMSLNIFLKKTQAGEGKAQHGSLHGRLGGQRAQLGFCYLSSADTPAVEKEGGRRSQAESGSPVCSGQLQSFCGFHHFHLSLPELERSK